MTHKSVLLMFINTLEGEVIDVSQKTFINSNIIKRYYYNIPHDDFNIMRANYDKMMSLINTYIAEEDRHMFDTDCVVAYIEKYKASLLEQGLTKGRMDVCYDKFKALKEEKDKTIAVFKSQLQHDLDVYFEQVNSDLYNRCIDMRANWIASNPCCNECGLQLELLHNMTVKPHVCTLTEETTSKN